MIEYCWQARGRKYAQDDGCEGIDGGVRCYDVVVLTMRATSHVRNQIFSNLLEISFSTYVVHGLPLGFNMMAYVYINVIQSIRQGFNYLLLGIAGDNLGYGTLF